MLGVLTNKIGLSLHRPNLKKGFAVWTAHLGINMNTFQDIIDTHLTCGNRAERLDVSPGALPPVPPAKPRVHGKSLATEITLPGRDS